MFVRLPFPSVLNSHIKGADGAGLHLPSCAGNERRTKKKKKRETSQSGDAALKEMSCQDGKMSPGARLPLPRRDTGEKGSLLSDLPS